jgi:hypothetical protein
MVHLGPVIWQKLSRASVASAKLLSRGNGLRFDEKVE